MMIKADREAVRSMQTDEKGMKEIERARKNRGKRHVGRPISEELLKQYMPLRLEFDQKVLEQNLKENNKILAEAGHNPISWDEIYDKKVEETKTSRDAFEHWIEMVADDNHCRIMISDNAFSRAQQYLTKLGKGKTLRSGSEIYWDLPCKCFVFGGRRYSVLKSSKGDTEVHVIWSSQQPKWVVAETDASNWLKHFENLLEKHGGRRKDNQFLLPSTLLSIPKI